MEIKENDTMQLPVLPLRGMVVFPKSVIHFDIGRKNSVSAINQAMKADRLIFLSAQIDPMLNEPKLSDLYKTGVVAKVVQVLRQPDDTTRVILEGKFRAHMVAPVIDENLLSAYVVPLPEQTSRITSHDEALIRSVKKQFEKYIEVTPKMPSDIIFKVALCDYPGELADYIINTILLDYQTKQSVLEIMNPTVRLENVLDILVDETYITKLERDIEIRAKNRIDENQHIYFLREH